MLKKLLNLKSSVNILLAVFVLLLWVACHTNNFIDERLVYAEQIINRRPDSALKLVEAYDTTSTSATELSNAYALYLKTHAYDKLHLPITWADKMLESSVILDKGLKSDNRQLALVHYYTGIACLASDSVGLAAIEFCKTYKLMPKESNRLRYFTLMKLCECYRKVGLWANSRNFARRALLVSKENPEQVNARDALGAMVLSSIQLKQLDSARIYLNLEYVNAMNCSDNVKYLAAYYHELGVFYRCAMKPDSAVYYAEKSIGLVKKFYYVILRMCCLCV